MVEYQSQRLTMVQWQIAARGIRGEGLLCAMRTVPREMFVAPGMAEYAYEDAPVPIDEGQTISQPYIVALMIEAAAIVPGDRVLDVGAGSGYAAAVTSLVASRVYAIERHATLVRAAQKRFDALGYRNIELRAGDGTVGWPDAAPFDAILVAAGGPDVPLALKAQLAIGGRLVMPIGGAEHQQLIRVKRTSETEFDQEALGAVAFVPLIGEQGWAEDRRRTASQAARNDSREQSLSEMIVEAADEFSAIDDPAFARWFDRFADRRVVLLGEASHGTAEFYQARAAVTRHLVEHHGFTIVAVEADWPDAAAIDRYIRHRPLRGKQGRAFERFPTWMWRNTDVAALVTWMREYNRQREPIESRVGFYGLDIYNMTGSIAAVLEYLEGVDPTAAAVARQRYGCLTPWQKDPATYGQAAMSAGYAKCEAAVIEQCRTMLARQLDYASGGGDDFLDAVQNARLIAAAERYYRVMYYGGAESWNLRDTHMFETLENLLDAKPNAKAIVWAHNSHIGDARFTDMGMTRGELNIGQLCRQRFDRQVANIGFGTHHGTVAAASNWGGDMEIKTVRPSRSDSYEHLFHDTGKPRLLLDLSEKRRGALHERLREPRLERFIGVVYQPETERWSHYSEASLPLQFNAYVWFDRTKALTPLGPEHVRDGEPDTYPFGT